MRSLTVICATRRGSPNYRILDPSHMVAALRPKILVLARSFFNNLSSGPVALMFGELLSQAFLCVRGPLQGIQRHLEVGGAVGRCLWRGRCRSIGLPADSAAVP